MATEEDLPSVRETIQDNIDSELLDAKHGLIVVGRRDPKTGKVTTGSIVQGNEAIVAEAVYNAVIDVLNPQVVAYLSQMLGLYLVEQSVKMEKKAAEDAKVRGCDS